MSRKLAVILGSVVWALSASWLAWSCTTGQADAAFQAAEGGVRLASDYIPGGNDALVNTLLGQLAVMRSRVQALEQASPEGKEHPLSTGQWLAILGLSTGGGAAGGGGVGGAVASKLRKAKANAEESS